MNGKKLLSLILLLLVLAAAPVQAFAAEAVTAVIPFTVKNALGTVVIEAVNDAPLPAQTAWEAVSEGTFELVFTEPGDCFYKIYQTPGTEPDVTYDSTVYEVCVSVFVTEEGDLYTVTAIAGEGEPQKAAEIAFENLRATPTPAPTPPGKLPQTGDSSDPGIWVMLLAVSLLGVLCCLPLRKKAK